MQSALTNKAKVFFDGEHLVRIEIREDAELEETDMVDIINAKHSLVGERKHFVLFIPGLYASISEEARKISASPAHNRNAIAKAILITTMHQRIIANFFVKFNRPPVPTAVFNDEKKALKWMDSVLAGEKA